MVHVIIFLQLLSFIFIILPVLINVALITLLERKILGLSQSRKGPNKVSFQGLLQPFADAVKLFTNNLFSPSQSNFFVFILSPAINMMLVLWLWTLTPLYACQESSKLTLILFLFILSLNIYPLFFSGWSSNSKYPMLGATRGIAQTISYEISLALILLSLIFFTPSLSLFSFLYFYHFSYPLFLAAPPLILWLISCIAESNRTPFDFSEGESELVSGFNTEYGSGGFALLFMAEYGSILLLSMITSFFLVSPGLNTPSALTTCIFFCVWVWTRTTLPRYRYDKLMNLAWKTFLPLSLCWVLFTLSLKWI